MPQALPMIAYYAAGAAGATAGWAAFAAVVTSVAVSAYQQSSAREKARAAAAAAQRDRNITIRSGVAPRRIVLGTVRLAGVLMHAEFVGADQEYLDQVFALTHGEVGEFVGLYLDDEFVAAADVVDMVPQTGKFSGGAVQAQRVSWQGAAAEAATTVTIDEVPNDLGDVQAILEVGVGEAASQHPLTVASVVGTLVTFSAPLVSAGTVYVTYSTNANPNVPLRVQPMYGTESQATTTWAGVSTPLWTADHRLRGVSGFRVLYRLDANVFAQGLPNPTAVMRGPKGVNGHRVWDPRTSAYVDYTSNPALLAAWWRTLPRREGGCGVPDDWIDWDSVAAAANVCDELITVRKLDGSGYEDVKRYECHTVLSLDEQSPDENLRIILDSMAGEFPFAAGKYRCYAGAFRAATVTLTDADVAGDEPITFAPLVGADQTPPNVVTARIYSAAHNWVETGVPAVENTSYITADGQEEPLELDLPASIDLRQANYLMGVRLEQLRPGMAGQLTVLGRGADLMPMQTVQLDLDGYEALDGVTFEIRKRTNHWNGRYTLELREVRASSYTLDADRFTPPTEVEPPDASELWNVTPVDITSVANAALTGSDGSVVCRALVVWAEHPQRAVNPMGKIEVRYRVPDEEWTYANPVDGEREVTYISPLREGDVLFIEARARNVVGAVSAWTGHPPFTVAAVNEVPQDVEGAGWEIKPGQVVVYWDRWLGEAPLEIELRVGATWAGAEVLWSGVGTDYKHARPPNGTYKVWLAYRRAGVYSANPVSLDITVDDSIDPGATAGTLKLTTDRFPFFSFGSGTSHTAVPPGDGLLTITANLINLYGTATFVAEAFDARIGGASLGFITLGGTGNARTISAAQFVSLGAGGSVRRIHVTANIGAASDEIDIYRQDSTTTAPILYLSNPTHAVPTDESGEYGDYSGAETEAAVYEGLTDTTDDWTWSITPDSGVNATINGGAGPVANPASVLVAVSAMTVPTGAVLVEADDGVDTLSASFVVDKAEASGSGYQVVWSPRSEIRLPVTAAGDVASYDDAWSEYRIIKGGKLDDTPNWTPSKTDINVSSTLTGNRVQVTELLALGALGTPATGSVPWASAGWTAVHAVIDTPGAFLAAGQFNTGPSNYVMTSPMDGTYGTWTLRDVGASGKWMGIAYDEPTNAMLVIEKSVGGTNKLRRSTDNGETWSGAVNLPASSQWYDIAAGNGTVQISSQVSSTGCFSDDGGGTWFTRDYGVSGLTFVGHIGAYWIARDTSDLMRVSTDNGATWSLLTTTGWPSPAHAAVAYKGRLAVTFRYAATNKAAYYEPGGGWVVVTLPQFVTNGSLACIKGVLYMLGGAKVLYSTDGKRWDIGPDNAPGAGLCQRSNRNLDLDFLPAADGGSGSWGRYPLLATSATDGGVRMRFAKPGELPMESVLPVFKGAAATDVYAFGAFPGYLELPATSDGVVTDWSQATIVLEAFKNGGFDTANWAWTWTATNMTPSSGTGNVVTFTAMSADTGQLFPRASKPGQPDLVPGGINIFKRKGPAGSGPIVGGAFHVTEVVQTYVALRFKGNGMVQVKRGASGSWVDYVPWAGAIRAENSAKYLRVDATGHALDSGTTGTFLALTTDRDFVLSDATSGTHLTSLSVLIADDSAGTNAINGFGSLKLIVP